MSYLPLSRFKYNNNGTGRKSPQEIDDEYHLRLSGPSTVRTALFPALENTSLLDEAAIEKRSISIAKYPIYFVETHKINLLVANRSEERRVGKECLRLCRSRWSPYH